MIYDIGAFINKLQAKAKKFESGKWGVAQLISMIKLVNPTACIHGIIEIPKMHER